jgi:hypothetical protein
LILFHQIAEQAAGFSNYRRMQDIVDSSVCASSIGLPESMRVKS